MQSTLLSNRCILCCGIDDVLQSTHVRFDAPSNEGIIWVKWCLQRPGADTAWTTSSRPTPAVSAFLFCGLFGLDTLVLHVLWKRVHHRSPECLGVLNHVNLATFHLHGQH
jgi:hypothetical protein